MKRDMKLVKMILESVESGFYATVRHENILDYVRQNREEIMANATCSETINLLKDEGFLKIIKSGYNEGEFFEMTWKGFDLLDDLRKKEVDIPRCMGLVDDDLIEAVEQPKLVVIPPPPVLPPNTSPFAIRPQPLVDKSTPPGFRP